MSKPNYKRKHVIGSLLTVLEGEPMTTIAGSMASGHGAEAAAERSHQIYKQDVERETGPGVDL